MIDAPDRSWRYIGLPRTGSTFLYRMLKEHLGGIEIGGQHTVEVLYGARIIVSCRNPYTRLVSMWKHWRYARGLQWHGRQGEDQRIVPATEKECPFADFVSNLGSRKEFRDPFYGWTQSEWLEHVGHVDQVLRLENLVDDFKRAWGEPWFYLAGRENTSDAATVIHPLFAKAETMDRAEQWAYQDCLRFGYPTEIPACLTS